MSFSNEWTEYHLTPRGWEVGSERVDGQGLTHRDPPKDRVQTVRWREEQTSPYAQMRKFHQVDWESEDKTAIAALRLQYGEPPESL